jgi:hypothetical protein
MKDSRVEFDKTVIGCGGWPGLVIDTVRSQVDRVNSSPPDDHKVTQVHPAHSFGRQYLTGLEDRFQCENIQFQMEKS